MATYKPTFALQASDTNYRAKLNAIVTALVTTFGWTQTADTGQIDIPTATYPTGYGALDGYLVFAMGDALQATAPVFMRLNFGTTSAGGANYPAMSIEVGSSTDGAGTLTGTFGPKLINMIDYVGDAAATQMHFAGDSFSFVAIIRHGISASKGHVFFCERLRAADGTPTADGVFYGINPGNGDTMEAGPLTGGCQVLEWGKAVPPKWPQQWPGLCIGAGSDYTNVPTTSTSGGDTHLFPVIPIGWRAWNPSARLFVYYSADIASNSAINVSVYGTTRSILTAGQEVTLTGACWGLANDYGSTNNNLRPAVADY